MNWVWRETIPAEPRLGAMLMELEGHGLLKGRDWGWHGYEPYRLLWIKEQHLTEPIKEVLAYYGLPTEWRPFGEDEGVRPGPRMAMHQVQLQP